MQCLKDFLLSKSDEKRYANLPNILFKGKEKSSSQSSFKEGVGRSNSILLLFELNY